MTQENKQQPKRGIFVNRTPENINAICYSAVDKKIVTEEKIVGSICYGQTGDIIGINKYICSFVPDGCSHVVVLESEDIWTDEQGYENGLSR